MGTRWEKFFGKNPVKSVRFGKEPNGRARFLSPDEEHMNLTLQKTLAELKVTSTGGKGHVFKNAKGQPYQSPGSAWLRAVKEAVKKLEAGLQQNLQQGAQPGLT